MDVTSDGSIIISSDDDCHCFVWKIPGEVNNENSQKNDEEQCENSQKNDDEQLKQTDEEKSQKNNESE